MACPRKELGPARCRPAARDCGDGFARECRWRLVLSGHWRVPEPVGEWIWGGVMSRPTGHSARIAVGRRLLEHGPLPSSRLCPVGWDSHPASPAEDGWPHHWAQPRCRLVKASLRQSRDRIRQLVRPVRRPHLFTTDTPTSPPVVGSDTTWSPRTPPGDLGHHLATSDTTWRPRTPPGDLGHHLATSDTADHVPGHHKLSKPTTPHPPTPAGSPPTKTGH